MEPARSILVWPAWQRALHWALAASVISALVTHHGGLVHEISGYTALALGILRIVLGLIGPQAARFRSFVRGVRATLDYAGATLRGHASRHLNHNPLGAWMVLCLLFAAAIAGASGALYVTDRFWGVSWVISLHQIFGWSLLALALLHVAGVFVTSKHDRDNLVAAMVHGHKRVDIAGEQLRSDPSSAVTSVGLGNAPRRNSGHR